MEADNIWKVNGEDLLNNATYISHAMSFPGIDWGEIEGLDFDKDKCEMYVLSNRGRQIVLGMVSNCIALNRSYVHLRHIHKLTYIVIIPYPPLTSSGKGLLSRL